MRTTFRCLVLAGGFVMGPRRCCRRSAALTSLCAVFWGMIRIWAQGHCNPLPKLEKVRYGSRPRKRGNRHTRRMRR